MSQYIEIYYKDIQERIFTIKMQLDMIFYYKNALERIFIIKMHWKGFLI